MFITYLLKSDNDTSTSQGIGKIPTINELFLTYILINKAFVKISNLTIFNKGSINNRHQQNCYSNKLLNLILISCFIFTFEQFSGAKLIRYYIDVITKLSDTLFNDKEKYKSICDDLDSTFAELTGY